MFWDFEQKCELLKQGISGLDKMSCLFSIHFVHAGHLLAGRVGHRVVQASRTSDDWSVEQQLILHHVNGQSQSSRTQRLKKKDRTRTLKGKKGHWKEKKDIERKKGHGSTLREIQEQKKDRRRIWGENWGHKETKMRTHGTNVSTRAGVRHLESESHPCSLNLGMEFDESGKLKIVWQRPSILLQSDKLPSVPDWLHSNWSD
jgi:hypothetical protein